MTIQQKYLLRANSILTLLLICLLFIALAWLSQRYPVHIDLTRDQQHSLSIETLALLDHLSGPIDVTSYATEHPELRAQIKNFLEKYQRIRSDFNIRFINPDNVPEEVRRLGISINGELLVRYQERVTHVKQLTEEHFARALERLLRNETHWLAFLTGHGERHPMGQANDDFGAWGEQLTQRGFNVQLLDLNEHSIPNNTAVLIIADPQVALLANELATISMYIEQGGHLLWLAEPNSHQSLKALSEQLGIDFIPGKIMDTAGQQVRIDDPSIVLMPKSLYHDHPITADFQLTTLFPSVAAILPQAETDWEIEPLLSTATHTWLETMPQKKPLQFDATLDQQGPLLAGISLKRKVQGRTQRIVVLGDGDFLSNTYLENSGNLELGLRIINWLSQTDSLIQIPSRDKLDAELTISTVFLGGLGIFFLIYCLLSFCYVGFGLGGGDKQLKQA